MGRRRRRTPSIKPITPWITMPVRWSDLPDDLLQLVYSKVAGPLNRVRFAAVCRSWRACAITSPHASPPVLPWLIFIDTREDVNKTKVYCPEDGRVFRMSLPSQAVGKRFVGAHDGGWVAVLGHDMQLAVVNLFSGVEMPLLAKNMCYLGGWYNIRKIVFSESPTSSDCILATVTSGNNVALCRIGCPNRGWTEKQLGLYLVDIVFCNEQLYGLTISEELIKFEIGVDKDGRAVLSSKPHAMSIRARPGGITQLNNIIELHGKLVMVVRSLSDEAFLEPFFKVFELVDESDAYKWEEVTSLGDYAIFLGKAWSKAVCVSSVGHGGLRRSCIYSTDDMVCSTWLEDNRRHLHPTSDDAMWKIRSYVVARAPGGMWVLPPDF
ncbi:hypothetical protein CFC21_090506 [Triticum aestivum]|uniref:Uncharacterized protein n=2 Tax=Triticum aestivum TaxID=4565 RepID=A0A3B6PTA4_WHEAT|nr:hypothetical protein CFC21_090506 [Triticum aestivum]